ncbi:hypothetical protein AVEN_20649-1 [Araneus ventricosus]|uniref:Uncharacterized protein n=1 Tax=Araneus ventricosus TaxID=182803 RepID=A0A4Y2IWE7_ARAVE|nr:hypothetical protein AVEN_20649-1 [Araneus ventricosus]
MDGPDVNHKFFWDIREDNQSEEEPIIINIGKCGLHTTNCAFKTVIIGTDWSIVEFLIALYNFFKDVPARRGTYAKFSGSKIFPKKFCSIGWLGKSDIAQRAIEILPDVMQYVNSVKEDNKRRPSSSRFKIVAENITDPLLTAKLEFFLFL